MASAAVPLRGGAELNPGECNFLHMGIGDRVAQRIFDKISMSEIEELAKLSQTRTGNAGFGSTGIVNSVSMIAMKDEEETAWREDPPAHWEADKIFWALKKKGIAVPV